jgi:ribonuclease M5
MRNSKISLDRAVIVEGRYDKTKLESVIDALILPVGGFQVFTDKEMRAFIRRLAADKGIIVLTDSDAAGFKIRAFLRGMLPPEQITDVYIPDIFGREKRKREASKEGKLGVEGMSTEVLREAFQKAGVISAEQKRRDNHITKLDLYGRREQPRKTSRVLREAGASRETGRERRAPAPAPNAHAGGV